MTRTIRALGTVVVVTLATATLATACGGSAATEIRLAPRAMPGQPAGTVVVPAGTDPVAVLQRLQEAIIASGGAPTVVDHAAVARTVGVEIPVNTVVLGSAPAVHAPLLRADQRAAVNLPQRYLVRRSPDGAVTLTYDGADYVTAVSGVASPDARAGLRVASTAVSGQVVPTAGAHAAAPLIGITPADRMLRVFGSADVPVTVERLRRAADRAPSRSVAAIDMAAGWTGPGPPLRPTSLVLVSIPEAEAPLLAAAPTFGLELPMRFVVWLDEQNRTQIGYPDLRRLAARHGLSTDDPAVARMAADADRLALLGAGITEQ